MTKNRPSARRILVPVLLVLLLLTSSFAVLTVGLTSAASPRSESSNLTAFSAPTTGGEPMIELLAIYAGRSDLQNAFPNASTNLTTYAQLVGWAEEVVTGSSHDGAFASLAPFGYYYALMSTYNARPDLQAAFPQAYTNNTSYHALITWAGGVATGQWNDGSYATLAPFGYYYSLLAVYNERADLRAAFPHPYTNMTTFSELVSWAGEVVSGSSPDGAYAALAPFGYYYALMTTYNERADLQAAFPNAYSNFASYTELVNWAGNVVTGSSTDGANSLLAPYGYYYALMVTYNDRPDLQAAFPYPYTNFASYSALVNWAGGVVMGLWADGSFLSLAPFGYFYDMMYVFDSRTDVQTAFPHAYTNWAAEMALAAWAGAVVNGTIPLDSSEPLLEPFGYWFALIGWVWEQRSDLQSTFPLAVTDESSYEALLVWADEVVTDQRWDPAFFTLEPFTASYEYLG